MPKFGRMLLMLAALLLLCVSLLSQNTPIVIPAGTPEDKDLAAITAQNDPQKRIAAYEEFIKKYADNKPAVAYAEWQLSQQYLAAGDTAKAMEFGSTALAAYPGNLHVSGEYRAGDERQRQGCRLCRARCRSL